VSESSTVSSVAIIDAVLGTGEFKATSPNDFPALNWTTLK